MNLRELLNMDTVAMTPSKAKAIAIVACIEGKDDDAVLWTREYARLAGVDTTTAMLLVGVEVCKLRELYRDGGDELDQRRLN